MRVRISLRELKFKDMFKEGDVVTYRGISAYVSRVISPYNIYVIEYIGEPEEGWFWPDENKEYSHNFTGKYWSTDIRSLQGSIFHTSVELCDKLILKMEKQCIK